MNTRLAKAAFSVMLTSALTSACLPQATNEPGEGGGSITLASFISQQNGLSNQNMCRKIFECTDDISDAALIFGRYGSIDECVRGDAFGELTKGAFDLSELTRAGFEIDEEKARACLDQIQAQKTRHACSIDLNPQVCNEVFVGPGEEGDACEGDYHCGSGLVCQDGHDNMCGGTCVAEEPDDDEYLHWCGDSECAADEYCSWETDTCTPKLEEGDACEPSGIDVCSESSYDLMCQPREDGTGTARCVSMNSLDDGEYCGDNPSLCAAHMDCVEGRCAHPEQRPLAAAGESCQIPYRRCENGLVCEGPTVLDQGIGVCVKAKTIGQPCNHLLECEVDLTCLTTSGRTPRQSMQGVCTPLLPEGRACELDFDCETRNCEDGSCARLTIAVCE